MALGLGLLLIAPAAGLANPITDENALPGTPGWEVGQADTPNIDGYTNKTSIAPGESLEFRVSTSPAAQYRIRIYRLGWYDGDGARLMTCLPSCSTSSTGAARSTPSPSAQTGKIDAGWPLSNTLTGTTTANWTTGEYVAEYVLTNTSQSGFARYSPFVVRSNAPQASKSRILVVVPYNTYLAYNLWGGTSAYENNTSQSGPFPPSDHSHAYKVSFNRPYHRRHWRNWDLPLLRFLEREGYDVSYVSDTDVDANPNILQEHRTVIVSGHSEYWTKTMRDGFDAARAAGTNLFFAGANNAYWQVRYEDSSCASGDAICGTVGNRRTMVIYKEEEVGDSEDPNTDPALETVLWRDLGRPECELQGGVQYGSEFLGDGYTDYTTTAAGATDPWAAGTGLTAGGTITGLVGYEFDHFFPNCQPPGQPTILFSYQDSDPDFLHDSAAVRYTAPSGARVFSSGTMQWAWGLDDYRWSTELYPPGTIPTNEGIRQFTRNMLADLARPASPSSVNATNSAGTIQIDTTPRSDSRITSYKVYRRAGTGTFQPGDPGVTLICQNASGDCADTPPGGTYRYASVAVDQWNDSAPTFTGPVSNLTPPTAVNDSATVSEDAAATAVPVLSNDTNPGPDPITISSASDPANGTVALTGGSPGAHTGLTYRPDANYCNNPPGTSPDTFTYTINGGSTATVSMTVTCVDDAPVAVTDGMSVIEDDPATAVPVLANDTDVDGGPKTISSVTQPANGQAVITGGGTGLTYRPNANYCNYINNQGSIAPDDTFTYTLNGGSTAQVKITVDCRADAPVANDDSRTVNEDAAATAMNVLSNDTDAEGDPITISSASDPDHGTVVLTGPVGAHTGLTYQPDANYCGPDSFTYTVNGGDTATVSMTVTCVSDPATAVNDSATMNEDVGATEIPVRSNDIDPDGDPITISSNTDPANGTVQLSGGIAGARTTLTYQPDANYCNEPGPAPADTFTYTINGGSTATVSVTVNCVDDGPDAINDAASVNEDAPATAVNVLGNDTDIDGGPKTIQSVNTTGTVGTVVITGGGSGLTYRPPVNYCNNGGSPDSFTYTLNGGDTATVSMTVFCVADPPVAATDSMSVVEDDPATAVPVLSNDTDAEGDPITISSATDPANGTVVLTGPVGARTGLTYQPDANYCNFVNGQGGIGPNDTFNYTLNGGSTAQVRMTVDCVNDQPVAANDSASVAEDAAPTAVSVLSNDTDIESDPITISSATDPANGTVVLTGPVGARTGLTYQPDANYCNNPPGTNLDTFAYTVNGGSTATVSVTVNCVDDLPVAVNDPATVTEDDPATAIPVLTNDTDVDGGPKTIQSRTQPDHGNVVITGGGTGLTYQPNANYCGADTFSYTLNGGSTATVSMTVNCVNDPPLAVDDSANVTEDAAATAIDVLGNDTDVEGNAIGITDRTQATHGNVVITGGNTLTYRPNADYCGPDSFTYTVNGGDTATVSVTVGCVDDPPTAVNNSFAVPGNSGATALGVLANDTDIDGGPMTIATFTQPNNGTVAGTGGSPNAWTGLTYQPIAGYCGPDSFAYTLNGGSSATVSITVDCSTAAVAVDDSKTVAEDDPATAIDVLANDFDSDGGAITISSATDPANGTVVLTGPVGARTGLTYQPDANYCNNPPNSNLDTFTYTLNGGDTATVSVTVNCVDDLPVAVNDSASLGEDAAATAIAVLGNDTDIDGGPKTINAVTQPDDGAVVITGGGTGLTYQPDANYCGPDSFTYTVNGGDTATVSVTVNCVNDAPVAVDDAPTVSGNSPPNAIDVLDNDTDVEDDAITISSVTDPTDGTVELTGPAGARTGLTYQPDPGYCSDPPTDPTDDFTYTVNGDDPATVSVTVDCSQAPNAVDDAATVARDAPATAVLVLINDNDPDGGPPMSITGTTQPGNGTVVITGGGTGLTYQPNPGYCNSPGGQTDNFTYTLNGDDTATVSMTVTCPAASAPPQQITPTPPAATKKCKKGFKKVRGKCKRKRKRK